MRSYIDILGLFRVLLRVIGGRYNFITGRAKRYIEFCSLWSSRKKSLCNFYTDRASQLTVHATEELRTPMYTHHNLRSLPHCRRLYTHDGLKAFS